MKPDTKNALTMLDRGSFTCVVCKDDAHFCATERGVKPLLSWLDNGMDLRGFCAADKVVGRATAFLYVLLGVSEVYAHVMSRPAMEVLERSGIRAHAKQTVPGIINRRGTGPCPFEAAVMGIIEPKVALAAIRAQLAQMS